MANIKMKRAAGAVVAIATIPSAPLNPYASVCTLAGTEHV